MSGITINNNNTISASNMKKKYHAFNVTIVNEYDEEFWKLKGTLILENGIVTCVPYLESYYSGAGALEPGAQYPYDFVICEDEDFALPANVSSNVVPIIMRDYYSTSFTTDDAKAMIIRDENDPTKTILRLTDFYGSISYMGSESPIVIKGNITYPSKEYIESNA